jgi:hypothetical protein
MPLSKVTVSHPTMIPAPPLTVCDLCRGQTHGRLHTRGRAEFAAKEHVPVKKTKGGTREGNEHVAGTSW